MLTIGELARLAGTTVRAVRHYTAEGLIDEPPRDSSGYRRYGTFALIRVSRIKRLRDVGLSLEQIRGLLSEKPQSLNDALSTLDDELAAQEKRIVAQRRRIAELRTSSEDPEIPGELGEILRRLETAGVDKELLRREKEALLLVMITSPEGIEGLTDVYQELWGDPDRTEASLRYMRGFHALAELPEDSPEVERLVEDVLALQPEITAFAKHEQAVGPKPLDTLFDDFIGSFAPAQKRFMYLMAERVNGNLR